MSTDAAIVTGVRSLWQQGHLQDFTIQVEDHSFKVHKLIMASVSDYFHAMLTGGLADRDRDTIRLEVVSALAMKKLVDFIYKGKLDLKKENAVEILDAAMYLQITTAIETCVEFMVGNIDALSCHYTLSVFENYSLTDGVKHVKSFIERNVQSVVSEQHVEFVSYNNLYFLLENWKGSEFSLSLYFMKWVEADWEHRKTIVDEIMGHVRFCLMTELELRSIQKTSLYQAASGLWCILVKEALDYLKLPIHQKVLNVCEQSTVREEPTVACFTSEHGDPRFVTLNKNKQWRVCKVPTPDECYIAMATIEVNNFLIICAFDTARCPEWFVFDPRALSWSQLANMEVEKEFFEVVHDNGSLYTIGGTQPGTDNGFCDSIEKYTFHTNTWCPGGSLPDALAWHATCVFQGCIYVSGGKHSENEEPLSDFHCLNLKIQEWESRAAMLQPQSSHRMWVMTLYGEEVIVVLSTDFNLEYYKASSNQWTRFPHDFFEVNINPFIIPGHTPGGTLITSKNYVFFSDDFSDGGWSNGGDCVEAIYPEKDDNWSLDSMKHFYTGDAYTDGEYLHTFGALLSVPLHKLPPPVSTRDQHQAP